MALGILAVMLVPLATFSQTYFGAPLFNYTRYWMWMDDFMTEAWPFQDKYPGRVQLEQLPPEEKPSLSWYLQRHGIGDAAQRLGAGTREVVARFFFPEAKLSFSAFFSRPSAKKWEQPLAHRGIYLILLGGLSSLVDRAIPASAPRKFEAAGKSGPPGLRIDAGEHLCASLRLVLADWARRSIHGKLVDPLGIRTLLVGLRAAAAGRESRRRRGVPWRARLDPDLAGVPDRRNALAVLERNLSCYPKLNRLNATV